MITDTTLNLSIQHLQRIRLFQGLDTADLTAIAQAARQRRVEGGGFYFHHRFDQAMGTTDENDQFAANLNSYLPGATYVTARRLDIEQNI